MSTVLTADGIKEKVRDAFTKIGSGPLASTPEELSKRMADGIVWFAQVTKLAGIKP